MPDAFTAGAVVYAKDLSRVSAFYAAVAGLTALHVERDHVVLASTSFQLVVHAIPAAIAASIQVDSPPARREDAAFKLVFVVPDLDTARVSAERHGGGLNPTEREWRFEGYRVCDGHDPEGNVVQLRERAA